jgi:ssDNA-binding Zn-finger/Zn-ribbon topoisomerase 1
MAVAYVNISKAPPFFLQTVLASKSKKEKQMNKKECHKLFVSENG